VNARWSATLLPLVLAGCGTRAPTAITLRVATWGSVEDDSAYAKTLDGIYREFENENPGVKLQVEITPDLYSQKMVMNHVAGVDPDVMALDDANCAVFINNGLVRDLSPYLAEDKTLKLSDFYPNAVATYQRGSAQYAIPIDFTPMVMYYNKRLFDAAHVPYPDGTWNYTQFRQTAKRLTRNDSYGFVVTTWMPGWVMWLWNNGGDVLSPDLTHSEGAFDSSQNAETLGFLRDLVEQDHSSPSPSQASAMGIDYFAQGKAAMAITGHWSMIDYAKTPGWDNLGVAAVPHNAPQAITPLYEAGYAIPSGCPHPDLAWKFIKYMTSAKVQLLYNSSGIAIDARKDVSRQRAQSPIENRFLSLLPAGRTPYGAKVVAYDFVENQGLSAMSSILQNGVAPQTALTLAAERIDLEFKKR
jgi:multiple sugar transport system substrate-binding protein